MSFGINIRNVPVRLDPVKPLPDNKMSSCCGDAGRDGYSIFSAADRQSGQRPSVGGHPDPGHPRDWLL